MKLNQLRSHTAVIMAVTFIVLFLTGLLLFIAPHGPRSGLWNIMGLNKHQLQNIHLTFAFITIVLAAFHGYLNFRALKHYLTGSIKITLHPLLYAGAIAVAATTVGIML